ncbi:hypothetical protein Tco_0521105 [Tanacetum coccineum]
MENVWFDCFDTYINPNDKTIGLTLLSCFEIVVFVVHDYVRVLLKSLKAGKEAASGINMIEAAGVYESFGLLLLSRSTAKVTKTNAIEGKVDSSKASLVVTECSRTKSDKQDTSSSSRNYITHVVDADIRPVNDQVPFAEVQLTAQHNVLANEQQHSMQSEPIYDTHLLEKVC